MPELPGPPSDLTDEEREAWLNGAATVAQLQADQWAILAKQYREAAGAVSDGDTAGADDDRGEDDDEDETECPNCGAELAASFGGSRCLQCGYTEEAAAADGETTETTDTTDDA